MMEICQLFMIIGKNQKNWTNTKTITGAQRQHLTQIKTQKRFVVKGYCCSDEQKFFWI